VLGQGPHASRHGRPETDEGVYFATREEARDYLLEVVGERLADLEAEVDELRRLADAYAGQGRPAEVAGAT
jgi:hypothetical protein